MGDLQRLSPGGGVKPQANGGRKMLLRINTDEDIVCASCESMRSS